MKTGTSVIKKAKKGLDIMDFLHELDIQNDTVIIKPNWVDGVRGSFTEAEVLAPFLEYFRERKIIVTESYSAWRNEPYVNRGELPLEGCGSLEEAKSKRDWIRKQDKWFLEVNGFSELFRKYEVEYVNVTEEVWSGNTVRKNIIQGMTDEKYGPLEFPEFYSYIPDKLFRYQGAVLISLAKLKTEARPFGITASTKNLFGLIPDPSREKYHGDVHGLIPQAVLDINKVYRTLFDPVFITEGVYAALSGYMGNPKLIEGWGRIIGGRNSAEVDCLASYLAGVNTDDIRYLPVIMETFGGIDRNITEQIPDEFVKIISS